MFRGTALRVFLAVLIGLMSASVGTAMAEDSGDPSSEIETTTTDESTDTSTDSTIDDESTLPADEGETDATSDVETDTTSESDVSTDGETDTSTDESELTPETGEGDTTTETSSQNLSPTNTKSTNQRTAPQNITLMATGVSLHLTSSNTAIANTLPDGATWIASQGGTELLRGSISADTTLPTDVSIGSVPDGTYNLRVEAGSTYDIFDQPINVDANTHVVDVILDPVVPTTTVTVSITSSNPDVAKTLPAGTSLTIENEDGAYPGSPFDIGGATLPITGQTVSDVPYGDYTVTLNGAPNFQPYSETFPIDASHKAIDIVLEPVTEVTVTATLKSANPEITKTLPADTTLTVTKGNDVYGTYDVGGIVLPQSADLDLPLGDYTVKVNAGPTFVAYEQTFTIGATTEAVVVELQPVTQATVTLNLTTADESEAKLLPEGSTWTARQNGQVVGSGTFTSATLPKSFTFNDVPFGTYEITIETGGTYVEKTFTIEIDNITEPVDVQLVPVSLVDQIVKILIQILTEILEGSAA